jgi:hypothetical protein
MPEEAESEDEEAKSGSDDDSDGEKATAQMDPLELRFSQKKMRNVFADGKLIAESAELVRAVKRPPEEAEIYGAPWRLEAPFPPIEVIRWRCKLRDDTTGRPLVDEETGEQLFEPEESWFTLDNRRLYCLQEAAIRLLPERCTVGTIIEIRKDRRLREIRKFRTLDSGRSINVGSVVDGVPFVRWCWSNAKKNGSKNSSGQNKGKGSGSGEIRHHNHKGSKGSGSDEQTTNKSKGRSSGKGGKNDKGYGHYKGDSQRDYYYYNGWNAGYYDDSWYYSNYDKGGKGAQKKNVDGKASGRKASGRGGRKGGKAEKVTNSEPTGEQQ